MNELKFRVACSKAGSVKGGFVVIMSNDDTDCTVCDGKRHPLERPKKKRLKHLSLTNTVLDSGSVETNKQLKRALSSFNKESI